MKELKKTIPNKTTALLHDGVSPYTYLGVFYLKKFLELCPDESLSQEQENMLFLSFVNMQKAHENIEKFMQIEVLHSAAEDMFFPTVEEVARLYGLGKIVLDIGVGNMSSTVNKRVGICLFELVLNQTKHNQFTKANTKVWKDGKTIYARIVFEGVNETLPPQDDDLGVKLGTKLIKMRLQQWGGKLAFEANKKQQTMCWQLELPYVVS